jgi:hypothetical protein
MMLIKRGPPLRVAMMLTLVACNGGTLASKRPEAGVDAHADAGVDANADAGVDAHADALLIDPFAFLPITDAAGPVLACVACLKTQCREGINECINSATCREGLLCALGKCIAGTVGVEATTSSAVSSGNFACLLDCFKGDIMAAILAAESVDCVVVTCSNACRPGLPSDSGADAPLASDGPASTRIDGGRSSATLDAEGISSHQDGSHEDASREDASWENPVQDAATPNAPVTIDARLP